MLPWRGRDEKTHILRGPATVKKHSSNLQVSILKHKQDWVAAYGLVADKLVQLRMALWAAWFKYLLFSPNSLKNKKDQQPQNHRWNS